VYKLQEFIKKINTEAEFEGDFRFNEPMASHTTFKVGGKADLWLRPSAACFPDYATALLGAARKEGIPVFILGGGSNLVVADAGIRGIVLDCGGNREENFRVSAADGSGRAGSSGLALVFRFPSGMSADAASEAAAEAGLSGLEFLAGMPGTIGGAVWMNARCYGRETAGVLAETEVLAAAGFAYERRLVPFCGEDFSYKRSPFQNTDALIVSARFKLIPGSRTEIRAEMEEHRRDRGRKGHYRYPCAGSVFKNNKDFGKPTGMIIDELGLRGLAIGGAEVASFHGNIIINKGNARAADIKALTEEIVSRVEAALGFKPECEILFAGDWS
jgi:UDP-N-acetylmuramate dehydrogenase